MALHKVPATKATTQVGQAYFIPWDDELKALYLKQEKPAGKTSGDKLSMSKSVRDWFHREAVKSGWDAASPVRNVGDQVGAGFVVWKSDPKAQPAEPEKSAPKESKRTRKKVGLYLVLRDIDEDDED